MKRAKVRKTLLGEVDEEVLGYTVAEDPVLDQELVEADCMATAAHVIMLSRLPVQPPLFTAAQADAVIAELRRIVTLSRKGQFRISAEDQDVHMAIEKAVTRRLGKVGKNIHCGRSRNDLVATDLRLYMKDQLLDTMTETTALAGVFVELGARFRDWPMVGRTHLQPAMPSSVGLWATSFAESLLDDVSVLDAVYEINDRSPLGAAAGYGVSLPLDRKLVARLLGFREPVHNTLYAVGSRGKIEAEALFALAQVMNTLSRFAADMVLFAAPEFGYVRLPDRFFTGSSIMPQKKNPDLFELIRSRAAIVAGYCLTAQEIMRASTSGYNRDVQDTKGLVMRGFHWVRTTLRVLLKVVPEIEFDKAALEKGFRPEVFATDRAMELVSRGVPFREAYERVKASLHELTIRDIGTQTFRKVHEGAPGGLDYERYRRSIRSWSAEIERRRGRFRKAKRLLLGL